MPNFTNSVGRGGENAVHDVAALQGAFTILANQSGLKFWDGQIDGKMSGPLIAGILAFEKHVAGQSAPNSTNRTAGQLQPNGPVTRQLKQLLPAQYQSLQGIAETACLTIKDPYARAADKQKLQGLALHEACRKDLDRLIEAGASKLGLELVLDEERTDHKGRCIFTLKPHGVKCLDARLNPLGAHAPTPPPIIEAVSKHAASATTLDMSPHGSKLEVTTRASQAASAGDVNYEAIANEVLGIVVAELSAFANSMNDAPKIRKKYIDNIRTIPSEAAKQMKEQGLSHKQAAELASKMRNEFLGKARNASNSLAKSLAEYQKRQGKTLPELEKEKAKKLFGSSIDSLSERDKRRVWKEIIDSAARDNPASTKVANFMGDAAKKSWYLAVAVGTYQIVQAENKKQEAINVAANAAGGAVGGRVGAAAGVFLCGPVCAIAGFLIGSALGGYAAEELVN